MSNIKALDKLREFVEEDALLVEMIEAVEHEVSERFMELPVDADGVPIRPDDLMACTAFDTNNFDGKEHVMAVGNGFWVDKDGCTHIPSETRHVKPRTIEDVLSDAVGELFNADISTGSTEWDEVIAKYAEEIRGMME